MKAGASYRLILTRGGLTPAVLADVSRVDHVEVVEIDSGEAVLFWDLTPQLASRRAREVRDDLTNLSPEEFMARWATVDQ